MSEDIRQKIIIVTDDKELKNLLTSLGMIGVVGKKGAGAAAAATGLLGSKLGKAGQAAKALAASLGLAGKMMGLIATGGAIAAIGAIAHVMTAATLQAAKFEQKFREVTTLFDTAKTSSALLQKQVLDLSTQGPLKLLDLTQGLYDLVSAGVSARDAVGVLGTAMKLAVGGVTDADTAIDGLTSAMNAWNISARDATDVTDAFFVAIRNGKCVTGDTRVLLADGRYERIDSLRDGGMVVSWDGRNFTPMEAAWVDQGVKPVVKLTTKLGRTIKTTAEHPYLTPNGWKMVQDLRVGDRIAVPTSLPYFGSRSVPEHEAALVGLWIAEGASQDGVVRLASTDYGDQISSWSAKYGADARNVEQRDGFCPTWAVTAGGNRGKSNPVLDMLRGYGLLPTASGEKHIPEDAFSWDRRSVATLLHWLFNGDGWITDRGARYGHLGANGFILGLCSKSERLIRDVNHLLLRFGIVGTVRHKAKYNAWYWETRRYDDVRRFVDQIGIDRPDAAGVYSYERKGKIKTYDRVIEYSLVKAIEDLPEEPVYDLVVPGLENFVAEDIVAHNTTAKELSDNIGTLGPIAAATGVSLDEAMAGVAAITTAGVRTNQAMTQLRSLLVAVARQVPQTVEVAKEMGVAFDVGALRAKGLRQFLDDVLDASKGNETQLTRLVGRIEALNAIVQLTGSQSEKFAKNLEDMKDKAGSTTEAFDKMRTTTVNLTDQIGNRFNKIMTELGLRILPVVNDALQTLLYFMGQFDDPMKQMIDRLKTMDGVSKSWLETLENAYDLKTIIAEQTANEEAMRSSPSRVGVDFTPSMSTRSVQGFGMGAAANIRQEVAVARSTVFEEFDNYANALETQGIDAVSDALKNLSERIGVAAKEAIDATDNQAFRSAIAEEAARQQEIVASWTTMLASGAGFAEMRAEFERRSTSEYQEQRRLHLQNLETLEEQLQVREDEASDMRQGLPQHRQYMLIDKQINDMLLERHNLRKRMRDPEDALYNKEGVIDMMQVYDRALNPLRQLRADFEPFYNDYVEDMDRLRSEWDSMGETIEDYRAKLAKASAPGWLKTEISALVNMQGEIADTKRDIEAFEALISQEGAGTVPINERMTGAQRSEYSDLQAVLRLQQAEEARIQAIIEGATDVKAAVEQMFAGDGEGLFTELINRSLDPVAISLGATKAAEVFQESLAAKKNALEFQIMGADSGKAREELIRELADIEDEAYNALVAMGEKLMRAFPEATGIQDAIGSMLRSIGVPDTDAQKFIDEVASKFEGELARTHLEFSLGIDPTMDDNDVAASAEKTAKKYLEAVKKYIESNKGKMTSDEFKQLEQVVSMLNQKLSVTAKRFAEIASKAGGIAQIAGALASVTSEIGEAVRGLTALFQLTGSVASGIQSINQAKVAREAAVKAGNSAGVLSADMSQAASTIGIVGAVVGFSVSLAKWADQRHEQHLEEIRHMEQLSYALDRNREQLEKNLSEAVSGRIGMGVTSEEFGALRGINRLEGGSGPMWDYYDAMIRDRGSVIHGLDDDYTRDVERIRQELLSLEQSGITGMEGLVNAFDTAMGANGGLIRDSLDPILDQLRNVFGQMSEFGQGSVGAGIESAIALFDALTSLGGSEAPEALRQMFELLGDSKINGPMQSFIQQLAGFDASTEAGRQAMIEMINELSRDILSGAAAERGFFEGITPEQVEAFLQTTLSALESSSEAVVDWVQSATDALGIFTGLLGKEGAAALQFFIDRLMGSSDSMGQGLVDALQTARGLDLTSQQGQRQLEAMIAQMAEAILAGSTMEAFGVSADQLEQIANQLQQLGREAFDGNFTAQTGIARTVTEIQGNEVIILLNEISHWTRELVMMSRAAQGLPLGGSEVDRFDVPIINGTRPIDDAVARIARVGQMGTIESAERMISLTNNFDINLVVQQDIDDIVQQLGDEVRSKLNQAFPVR